MSQFAITLFISALLLFIIQPMAAKALLPLFGGAPMVWTVAMMYFQAVLLLAYGYAYLLSQYFSLRMQQIVHFSFALLSLLLLPILWTELPSHTQLIPTWQLLKLLITQLTLPLWVVSSSAPLLQAWFHQTQHPKARDPYFLYAASNLGSFTALLSYPFVVERFIGLKLQSAIWSVGFALYLLLLLLIIVIPGYKKLETHVSSRETVGLKQAAEWIFLSFIPVSLMLGVTFYITTDIASIPLFWVVPLALYLLTFVLAFSNTPLISPQWVSNNVVFVLIFAVVGFIFGYTKSNIYELIIIHLLNFFMLAMLCHGRLYTTRPKARLLTQFYLLIALGGLLAGVFNSLLAPVLFKQALEYPLSMLLVLLVLPQRGKVSLWKQPLLIFCILMVNYWLPMTSPVIAKIKSYHVLELVCLIIIVLFNQNSKRLFLSMAVLFLFVFVIPTQQILWQGRNFFGIKKVVNYNGVHSLISQTTVHGIQDTTKSAADNKALSYYQASLEVATLLPQGPVAIVGLGVGMTACQFDARTKVGFYEIDAQIVELAQSGRYFSLLRQCQPNAQIKLGDARLKLVEEKNHTLSLIILDAFNSDAIPTHLLTREAMKIYFDKLQAKGGLLIHISNRHLNLVPVIAHFANANGLTLLYKRSQPTQPWQYVSDWVFLSDNKAMVKSLIGRGWQQVQTTNTIEWTDDYSNIIPLLK